MSVFIATVKGLSTYLPGLYQVMRRQKMGGADSAQYCYEVWLKHLIFLHQAGFPGAPRNIAELGPGDSLGVGICALLTGAKTYSGLDVYPFTNVMDNLSCLEELVDLLNNRTPCNQPSWPPYQDLLDEKGFPSHILTDDRLRKALDPKRISMIRQDIKNLSNGVSNVHKSKPSPSVRYFVPWMRHEKHLNGQFDLILSHSVLEHVPDMNPVIDACAGFLCDSGWMSHQVDFSSHGLTKQWNGHWAISHRLWTIILGRRQFLINRQPVSILLHSLSKSGFIVHKLQKRNLPDGIKRHQLDDAFRHLSEADFECAEAMLQCQKII